MSLLSPKRKGNCPACLSEGGRIVAERFRIDARGRWLLWSPSRKAWEALPSLRICRDHRAKVLGCGVHPLLPDPDGCFWCWEKNHAEPTT